MPFPLVDSHWRCTLPGNVRARLHAPTPRAAGGESLVLLDGALVRATRSAQGAHVFVEVGGGMHEVAWV